MRTTRETCGNTTPKFEQSRSTEDCPTQSSEFQEERTTSRFKFNHHHTRCGTKTFATSFQLMEISRGKKAGIFGMKDDGMQIFPKKNTGQNFQQRFFPGLFSHDNRASELVRLLTLVVPNRLPFTHSVGVQCACQRP